MINEHSVPPFYQSETDTKRVIIFTKWC